MHIRHTLIYYVHVHSTSYEVPRYILHMEIYYLVLVPRIWCCYVDVHMYICTYRYVRELVNTREDESFLHLILFS